MISLNSVNRFDVYDKHVNLIEDNGLSLQYPRMKEQEIIYNANTNKYHLVSVIPHLKEIESLEEKLIHLEQNGFKKIKKEDIKDISEGVRNIEEAFGGCDFSKIRDVKRYSGLGYNPAAWQKEGTELYLLDGGMGIYFGDRKKIPKLSNIKLLDNTDVPRILEFLIDKDYIKREDFFYDNGIDFGILKKNLSLLEASKDYSTYDILANRWTTNKKIRRLEKRFPKIKNISFMGEKRSIRTMGEFRTILSGGRVNSANATNFRSVISEGNIDLHIPEDYFFNYENEVIGEYSPPLDFLTNTTGNNKEIFLRFWEETQTREAHKLIDAIWPYRHHQENGSGIADDIPKAFSRSGKIHITCDSPDVEIIYPGMSHKNKNYKYKIFAYSGKNKGKVKVKYTDGRKI